MASIDPKALADTGWGTITKLAAAHPKTTIFIGLAGWLWALAQHFLGIG